MWSLDHETLIIIYTAFSVRYILSEVMKNQKYAIPLVNRKS